MTNHDPFVDSAPEPAQESPTATAVKTAAVSSGEDGRISVTLKGGSGHGSPWIVIYAASVRDALDQMSGDNATALAELCERTAKVGAFFAAKGGGSAPANGGGSAGNSGGGQRQAGRPAAADEAPNGEKRYCEHGQMQWKSGVARGSGKAYAGWFCTERDKDAQCSPQWPDRR